MSGSNFIFVLALYGAKQYTSLQFVGKWEVRVRAAIYARTAVASQEKIEEQIGNCRLYADIQGWQVTDANIFRDDGLSGLNLCRPGLESLLDRAADSPAPFDLVLVEDLVRLGRDQSAMQSLIERLRRLGVHVHAIYSGYDSRKVA